MAPNPRRQDERLQELYDELPEIACRGLCHQSCGPITATVRETQRMERAAGKRLECPGLNCSMLGADKRCTVYDVRPLLCRMYGVVEKMRCPHGCEPEGGFLPAERAAELFKLAEAIGGPYDVKRVIAELERFAALEQEIEAELARRKLASG